MFKIGSKITVFDIGSKNIKIIIGNYKDKKINISKYHIAEISNDIISNGKINNKEALVELLGKFKIKTRENRLLLSSNDLILRTFDMPKMEIEELKEAVKFEMAVLLSEDLSSYIIDAGIMDEYTTKNKDEEDIIMYKVQGVAIEKDIINTYINCFSKAGIKITVVDTLSNSLLKLFSESFVLDKEEQDIGDKNLAIIDLGYKNISVSFIEDKKIFLHRILNRGEKDIVEKFAEDSDFSQNEIRQVINNINIENQLLTDFLSEISLEIYQLFEFFVSMSENKKVDNVILTGGAANIQGLDDYMAQFLNTKVEVLNKFQGLQFEELKTQKDIPILANGLGVFIRRE